MNWLGRSKIERMKKQNKRLYAEQSYKLDLGMNDPRKWEMILGSYKGLTLEAIHKIDPKYIPWMRDSLRGYAQKKAIQFLEDENDRILKRGRYGSK